MTERRSFIRGAAALALAPALGMALPLRARAAARFSAPTTPMIFTRTLIRELVDGAAIEIRRDFAIHMTPTLTGYTVLGEQVDVRVTVPPPLAAFAEIERKRKETNLFPMALNASGMIESGPQFAPAEATELAMKAAVSRLEKIATRGDMQSHKAFLAQVEQSLAQLTARLPQDLFVPQAGPVLSEQTIALPDGSEGRLSVRYAPEADPVTGLLREAQREVVTQIGASTRRAFEKWTLNPAK